jgi:hypothetical protein
MNYLEKTADFATAADYSAYIGGAYAAAGLGLAFMLAAALRCAAKARKAGKNG